MDDRTLLVGFDAAEADAISQQLPGEAVAHEMLPRIVIERGKLFAPSATSANYQRITRVIFHAIYDDDLEFLAGLALWGGPCFPNAAALMQTRLRLPCLVQSLRHTRFGGPRGFAFRGATYDPAGGEVAKWGNRHCGENKIRIDESFRAEQPTSFEPYIEGDAVRITLLGDAAFQTNMTGPDWLKSVHGDGAILVRPDAELVADTEAVRRGLGLEIIANDYIVSPQTGPYLLEANAIPSVTSHPQLWTTYLEVVTQWATQN